MQQSPVVKFSEESIELKRSQCKMEEIGKSDVSFPHEPGADAEQPKGAAEESDVFMKLWNQAMAEVDYLARKLASAACCDEENLVQEKKEQYREVSLMNEKQDEVGVSLSMQGAEQDPYLMQVVVPEVSGKKAEAETMEEEKVTRIEKVHLDKVETNWCGEVPLLINRQESVSLSKQGSHPDVLRGEDSEVTDMKAKAEEEFKKCDNSFPHEPGADSEQSKIKEMKEIYPWAHWKRWRRCGAAECFPRLSKKAEVAEAQTSSKKEMEMDLEADKLVNYAEAAEQPDFKELMLRQHNLNTKEVEKHADAKQLNYIMKAETEAKENRMQLKKVKQSLKEEKLSRYSLDWHKLSPLIADKLVPPDREGGEAEAEASVVSSVKVVEIGAKDRLGKVEKDWQGNVLLVIDKQDLVEVSLSKMVEMELMHTLKAEAVQVSDKEQKLTEEELLEFCKQYPEVKEWEKEGHEAPPLLVDKQAADAG